MEKKDADALKQKIINDYYELLKNLLKGKVCDYQCILEELSLLDVYDSLENNYNKTLLQIYCND